MKKVWLIILFFLFSLPATAQKYRYTYYSTETGDLPQNQITSLFQDSKGNIWIGTKLGAAKFDGETFQTFYPPQGKILGDIRNIFETSKGDILLVGGKGAVMQIRNNKILHYARYKKNFSFGSRNALIKDTLFLIAYKSSLQLKQNLISYINGKFSVLNDTIKYLGGLAFANDTLWAAASSPKITPKGRLGYFNKHYEYKTITAPDWHFGYLKNRGDTLYLIQNYALHKYYNGNIRLLNQSKINYSYAFYPDYYYAFSISTNVIAEYNYYYKLTDKFCVSDVQCVLKDKENNLWFGTENGLYKLSSRIFRHYIFADYGLEISNPGIVIDQNNRLWLSSLNQKLYRFTGNEFEDYSGKLPVNRFSFMILSTCLPDGTLIWGRSGNGILKRKNNQFVLKYNQEIMNSVFELYYDTLTQNTLYGNHYGVAFENQKEELFFRVNGLQEMIVAIEKDTAGNYWFASRRHVYSYKNEHLSPVYDTLLERGALDIEHDTRHNLWFGGEGGLIFYDNKNFTKIKHISLENIAITALHEIGDSVLLIGSTSGMAALDLKTFYRNNHKIIIKYFNSQNGFSSYECAQNGFVEDKDGFVWVAVNDRIIRIDPRRLNFKNVGVKPYITSVLVLKNVYWEERDTALHELRHNENNIKFKFSGAYFSNPVSYAYYLEGYEKNWSNYGKVKEAVYANLPYGDYTFHVKAANGDDRENTDEIIYRFSIKPAFWQTLWFYIIIAGLFLGTVYLSYKWKLKKSEAMREKRYQQQSLMLRNQVLQLDPHFIFNTLTVAGTFALRVKETEAYDIIVRLSQLLRAHLRNEKLTRTLKEELNFVKEYCELNRINHDKRFDYFIEIDENVNTSLQVVKLSIQNFVENAIKHGIENISGKGIIKINISQDLDYTYIVIDDNGIGYNKAKQKPSDRKRVGIKTVHDIFNIYNSWNEYKLEFEIKDKSDINPELTGTIVTLKIPNQFEYEQRGCDK